MKPQRHPLKFDRGDLLGSRGMSRTEFPGLFLWEFVGFRLHQDPGRGLRGSRV